MKHPLATTVLWLLTGAAVTASLCWSQTASATLSDRVAVAAALAAKYPQSEAVATLIARFPLLAAALAADHLWDLEPNELKAKLLPREIRLQQGSHDYPLVFSVQYGSTWRGEPVWGQVAYELEYYCFDPARPAIKLHIGRPLDGVFQHNRIEAVAAARRRESEFPTLDDSARREIAGNVEKVVESLRPYGAARLPFRHPKIAKYALPGGTRLTVSDFSGSLCGSVYLEITLEPAQPVAAKAHLRLPAFPGAEGYGAYAVGGRGGKVYLVTTLEDYLPSDRPGRPEGKLGQPSVPPKGYDPRQWVPYVDAFGVKHEDQRQPLLPGYPPIPKEKPIPGSLRVALDAKGPRTILFAVSGTIELKAPLQIRNPYVTLVGNTAPGEGVQIRNWGIVVSTHDVILRYLRVRVGDIKGPGKMPRVLGDQSHALDLTGANIIVDHCDLAFANDQIVDFYGKTNKRLGISFQWNYVYGGLLRSTHEKGEHSMSYGTDGWGYVSMHHNLTAHTRTRNPRIWGLHVDYRNNILYDYVVSGYGDPNDYLKLNYVGNVQKRGKQTWGFQSQSPFAEFYAADNRLPAGSTGDLQVLAETLMPQPWESMPVTTDSAEKAYESILRQGGASLPVRDVVTQYAADTTRAGTGQIPKTTDDFPAGGFPTYKPGQDPFDVGPDGIPSWWKKKYGLDTNDPSLANQDLIGDGYTNLEKYLYGIDPTRKTDQRKGE